MGCRNAEAEGTGGGCTADAAAGAASETGLVMALAHELAPGVCGRAGGCCGLNETAVVAGVRHHLRRRGTRNGWRRG